VLAVYCRKHKYNDLFAQVVLESIPIPIRPTNPVNFPSNRITNHHYTTMSRTNDGLDPSSTTDAYGGSGQGDMGGMRGNDGLDTSNTTDAYSSGGLGGRSETGGMRGNDGLQTSNTTDAYSSGGLGGRSETGGMRGNDGLQTSNTTDAYSSGGMDRSTGGKYADPSYGGMSPHSLPFCLTQSSPPTNTSQTELPAASATTTRSEAAHAPAAPAEAVTKKPANTHPAASARTTPTAMRETREAQTVA